MGNVDGRGSRIRRAEIKYGGWRGRKGLSRYLRRVVISGVSVEGSWKWWVSGGEGEGGGRSDR